MELERLEDIIKEEIVKNRKTLSIDASSTLKEIPNSTNKFYIHLADYFDVMAGKQSTLLLENALCERVSPVL